ncbi:hypothetical protein [Kitasatospora sp. MBT63]|uniref:hypothetical protein n=1 Tax=Kitasatospora sp. MBT63 TaxID=1444768 RepID=UPI00053BBC1F|nr:hypothetical protein [Kitasatospora sp. MBT63]
MKHPAGFLARYGASPLHLLLVLCSFALALYAGIRLLKGDLLGVAIWFVGAALLHDLVLLPLYTLTDRAAQALTGGRPGGADDNRAHRVPPVNYLRVPAFLSLLLLAVWYPLILRRVPGYRPATALDPDRFLGHWLLLTAGFFALSAACLLAATARGRRKAERGRHAAKP